MHASPFDFVSVLSAEECCPVCSELHASVDQCECAACGSQVCPDCASLRPDTSWVCATCVVRLPSLAAPPSAPPVWLRGYLALSSVTSVLGRAGMSPRAGARVARFSASAVQTVRSRAHGALSWLVSVTLALATLARRVSLASVQRAGRSLSRAESQVRSLAALVRPYARHQQRLQRARLRYLVGSFTITLRNVHFRQHASSLLIATAILIAVARAQTSSDGR